MSGIFLDFPTLIGGNQREIAKDARSYILVKAAGRPTQKLLSSRGFN